MIPHCAQCASSAHPPVPIGEGIGEGFTATGEGIGVYHDPLADALASISDRLAVVAVAAHIMQRRAPRDCYARSIARETQALALAVRELHRAASGGAPMRAPWIVDASPSPSPLDATDAAPAPSSSTARRSTRTPRQTPPQARHKAQASECATHPHASPEPSLAASGGAADAEGGAQ